MKSSCVSLLGHKEGYFRVMEQREQRHQRVSTCREAKGCVWCESKLQRGQESFCWKDGLEPPVEDFAHEVTTLQGEQRNPVPLCELRRPC